MKQNKNTKNTSNKHNIAIIGTGYVGLVSGTCFAEIGGNVTCVDVDATKINALKKGKIPIFEPELDVLVKKNFSANRLNFTTDFNEAVSQADIVFIAVGTPPQKNGGADLSFVFKVAEQIAASAKDGVVVVTKSTVPVGTGAKVKKIIAQKNKKLKFSVASNPEFLREGCAIQDFLKPDRVIIGADAKAVFDKIASCYKGLKNKNSKPAPILFTDIQTAELTKYAANAFLATKVAFINEMADLCEAAGANIDLVAKGMGLDERISPYFLKVGPGFGGSCFPKDTLALQKIAADLKRPSKIVEAVIESNDLRKNNMAKKIITAAGGSAKGKNIAVLGLAFKANTDDMRDSAALNIVPALVKAGAKVSTYDPEASENAKKLLGAKNISYCKTMAQAIKDADVIAIVTEWEEFKTLDLKKLAKQKNTPIIVDLRNILPKTDGIKIIQLGK
jgi:UDPglucose 6-dehydrogenase